MGWRKYTNPAGLEDSFYTGLGEIESSSEEGGSYMSKPTKQKSSGVSCLIDGVNTRRIKTIGVNSDTPRDQIQEMANSGVVQYIDNSPTVTIQLETNGVGSTDTMAMVCDALIPYTTTLNDTSGALPIGGIYRHYIKAASSNASYRTITQDNMLNGYCSILATFNEDGSTAKRTCWMNHCAVTSINLSYDVNGDAVENYTLIADNKTWFLNELAGVRCHKPIFKHILYNDNGLQFDGLDSAMPNGARIVALGVNNNILRSRSEGGVTGNATFTAVTGGAFTATSVALSTPWVSTVSGSTDRVWIIFKPTADAYTWEATVAGVTEPGWELEASSGAIGALRRGNIKAYLWNTETDSESSYTAAGRALRLQSVSIDASLGEDQLFELGTHGFYAVSKQTPVPITVTVSANDSDLQYFAYLLSTAYGNTNVKTMTISDFNGYNALRVELYKDKAQTILLETVYLNKMYVQSENFNVSVGDNATHEITFTTDNISITGSGVCITGGPNAVAGM